MDDNKLQKFVNNELKLLSSLKLSKLSIVCSYKQVRVPPVIMLFQTEREVENRRSSIRQQIVRWTRY